MENIFESFQDYMEIEHIDEAQKAEDWVKDMMMNSIINNNPKYKMELVKKRFEDDIKFAQSSIKSYLKRQAKHKKPEAFDILIQRNKKWVEELEKELKDGLKTTQKTLSNAEKKKINFYG